MRELVECLRDWLAVNRADGSAYLLFVALTRETLKRVDSSDVSQREFDAQQLAAAAEWKNAEDFEASKRWVDRANLKAFAEAREVAIEGHARAAGYAEALRPKRRSPGGKHRAMWYLERYPVPDLTVESQSDERAAPDVRKDEVLTIQYEFIPPGQVKAAWYARPLVGAGSFITRSWRGLLWIAVLLVPPAYLLLSVLTALGYTYLRRPLQTSDLASLVVMAALAWIVWRMFIRPTLWLLDDRIIPATELWVAWGEESAQLELAKDDDNRRRLQLVRYTAVCPICAGMVELRYSQGPNRRRLVGCCSEAPHDHIFSFDRIRRIGRQLAINRR